MTSSTPLRLSHSTAQTRLISKYFRGLGDVTRLRILDLLIDQELSVMQLVDRLEVPQPQVSNHLACLRWCGFVHTRRDHRTIYYSLADSRVKQMMELACALFADNAEHVATCAEVKEGKPKGRKGKVSDRPSALEKGRAL